MKRLLPILLIVGCTTQASKHDTVSEAKKPEAKKPEVTQLKKPTPPAKKQEVKPEAKPEAKPEVKDLEKEVVIPPIEDVLLKRQTLFAVACEQHPVVKGLANQYQRIVISFTDNTPEIAAATKPKDLATITITYTLKAPTFTASSPSDAVKKPIAKVICTVNEGVDKAKPSYKVESLSLNGVTLK